MKALLLPALMLTWNFAHAGDAARVLEIPDLIAFWDFQEPAGSPRVSKGGSAPLSLQEKKGTVQQIAGGIFGPNAAELSYGQRFQIDRKDVGPLDLHGKEAQVSVVAWVKRRDKQQWQAIAGLWDETRKKRQYCLFLNATTATRADEMKRYPVSDRIHGHVSGVGGPTPGQTYCITYSSGATAIQLGEWHCIAMSYDGKTSRVFLDGKLDAWEHRNPFTYDEGLFEGGKDGADFTVGAVHRGGSWGNFFGGTIGGLAVFKRALTDAEITALAEAGR